MSKAARLRAAVISRSEAFVTSGKVTKALIQAREAQLAEPATRAAFETYAPAIVQRLALLDEDRAQAFTVERGVEVDLDDGFSMRVGVLLDFNSRRAVTVLEDVCRTDLQELLQVPMLEVRERAADDVESTFRSIEDPGGGETDAAYPEIHFFDAYVDAVAFHMRDSVHVFAFEGHLETSMSSSLVQNSEDGSHTVDLQGDAYASGRFSFEAAWDSAEGGAPAVTGLWAELLDVEVSPPLTRARWDSSLEDH